MAETKTNGSKASKPKAVKKEKVEKVQSKSSSANAERPDPHEVWKENQQKYAHSAKDMFEKFSSHVKKPEHAAVHEAWKEHQHKYTQSAKDAFEKFSSHAHTLKPDHAATIASHKKNLEALNDANKMAADVMKSIANLQSQFVKQTFEDLNSMMRGLMTQKPGQPIDLVAHSESVKNSFQRTMEHAKSVGGVLSSSGKEIHARMHGRLDEAKEELKEHVSKYKKH